MRTEKPTVSYEKLNLVFAVCQHIRNIINLIIKDFVVWCIFRSKNGVTDFFATDISVVCTICRRIKSCSYNFVRNIKIFFKIYGRIFNSVNKYLTFVSVKRTF